jgi:hypothetical protein
VRFNGQFTRSWFRRRNQSDFELHLLPAWRDRPCRYLEIGIFEGASLSWMLEHVLTHTEALAVGVDPWLMTAKQDGDQMELVRQRAYANLCGWVGLNKLALVRGTSAVVLRRMLGRGGFAGVQRGSLDLCMIDGDHNALSVLDDARLVLPLMRPGGWILFDDVRNKFSHPDHVVVGVEQFVRETGSQVRPVFEGRHVNAYEVEGCTASLI